MSSRTSYETNRSATSDGSRRQSSASSILGGESSGFSRLHGLRRLVTNYGAQQLGLNSLNTPDEIITSLEIEQRKELNFAAFSPMAEYAAVAAGHKLQVFSWDRRANLQWTPCWTEIVLPDCLAASGHIDAIALSNSLVAVATNRGFEVYELHTPENESRGVSTTRQKKEPVVPLMAVSDLSSIALSPETSETSGRICVGTEDGRLLIWHIGGGSDEGRYILTPQSPELSLKGDSTASDIPSAVAFSHDSSRICVGSMNRHIYIYELGQDGWSLWKRIALEGDFGSGTFQYIRFTAMAFMSTDQSADQIAFTTDSDFPAGCPTILDIQTNKSTAFSDKPLKAQSLAVSPSAKRLVFVDSCRHTVMLVESSPGGSFDRGVRAQTDVTSLKRGRNPFIAAVAFTHSRSEEGDTDDGRERFLVMNRMGKIQLF
ncbi:hypothetical protein V2W45_243899 [Cenococcum geophilum]